MSRDLSEEESQDLGACILAAQQLGRSATWRRTMFAAGERPFFLYEISSDTSLIFSRRSVYTLLVIHSLVPPSPVTLSLPAEQSAQPPRLLTDRLGIRSKFCGGARAYMYVSLVECR